MLISEHYLDLFLLEYNPEIFMETYLEEFSLDPRVILKNKLAELMKDFWKYVKDGRFKIKEIYSSTNKLASSIKSDIKNGFIGNAAEKIQSSISDLLLKFHKSEKLQKVVVGLIISIFILILTMIVFSFTSIGGYIIVIVFISSFIYDYYKSFRSFKKFFETDINENDVKPVINKISSKLNLKEDKLKKIIVGGEKYTKYKIDESLMNLSRDYKSKKPTNSYIISILRACYYLMKKMVPTLEESS